VTTELSTVLTDPLGVVVDHVVGVESVLDRGVVVGIVEAVAGGRAKRRRLAQALLDRPDLLTDGRSPAPRAVGDLLIALRAAGALQISAPICAQCGKHLRTLQRRGEDWYCGACRPRREPCTVCGHTRPVHCRDRDGRPRCAQCQPNDEADPVAIVVDLVATVDPSLSGDQVTAAVLVAAPRAGLRQQLAKALATRPELLTGAGAEAPIPAVLRLIDQLRDIGAHNITYPACPRCQRFIHLYRRIDGHWLCRNCVAKSRAQPCGRCGAVREAAARDEHGRPLCPNCLISDPANQETCHGCGRRRRVSLRTPDGPLCDSCRPRKTLICGICGRTAPCLISEATGQPWCRACKQRWAPCTGCAELRPVRGGTREQPLCATCTRPDPGFWHSCPNCGQPGRIHNGRKGCAQCTIQQRLHDLLADDTGEIRPDLQALYETLTAPNRPTTVASWLDRSAAPTILRSLARRPLTHQALVELPTGKPVEHLRSVLVAIGTLPARDEQMARLERWIARTIADRPDPDDQQLLHRYAIWHLLRRLRGQLSDAHTTHAQAVCVRRHVNAAITLLNRLNADGLTLPTCQQRDLDTWLAGDQATHRREVGHFVRWAKSQKLTRLDFPATRWGGPSGVIDTETRWQQARQLLHDDTLKPDDRVAGLFVLLYAQWPATISRLTLADVDSSDDHVRVRLGHEPVVLPDPLADLVRELVGSRHGHAAIGNPPTSPWLFPGGQPGRPISAYQLAERLRQLGLHPGRSRSTALFGLATDLPAALLARMLGIHISVAVAWQRASGGDWTNYAADVSRRTNPQK
jgi:hypothetical protein